MQILLDGLAYELFEALLALGHVRCLLLLETGVASCGCLLFVLFDAAAVDGGDRKEMVREVVVALL